MVKVKILLGNIAGVCLITAVALFFLDAALKVPVSELDSKGTCLRVLNPYGEIIPNGCNLAKKGMIQTEHRYVAQ
jgi:hypothetical protein